MDPLRTEQYRGYTIEVYQSAWTENPREEWDQLGTIVHWHRRYELGEERLSLDEARDINANGGFYLWLEKQRGAEVILPLTFLDHGIQSIRIGAGAWACDPGGWDSGTVGFVYAERQKILDWYSRKRMSKRLRAQTKEVLRAEIATFDAYLRGEVYDYVILDPDSEHVDGCCLFFGHPDESGLWNDARRAIDAQIEAQIRKHAMLLKIWIEHRVPLEHRSPFPYPYAASA